jgi:hypothetical protein
VILEWRARTVLGLLCLGTCGGCERLQIPGLAPQATGTVPQTSETATRQSRYQLQKDREGRVIRLDTVTGEVTIVRPPSAQAPSQPTRNDRPLEGLSLSQADNDAGARAGDRSAPSPSPPTAASEGQEPPLSAPHTPVTPAAGADVCLRSDAFREAVTLADVPVYVEPRRLQTPVTTLASAVMVTVAERAGDWYLVRFDDPRFGPRVGYAHCSSLRALDRPISREP